MEQRLSDVTSLTHKPRPTATCSEFAKKWQTDVLSQTQTRNSISRQIPDQKALGPGARNHVYEGHLSRITSSVRRAQSHDALGEIREEPDRFARGDVGSSKGRRLQQLDPFVNLVLPDPDLINERCLTLDEMRLVIDSAAEPDKTFYWILAETGIRCGEACGLPAWNLLLDAGAINNLGESLARENRNGEVEKGQSSLRNFLRNSGRPAEIL